MKDEDENLPVQSGSLESHDRSGKEGLPATEGGTPAPTTDGAGVRPEPPTLRHDVPDGPGSASTPPFSVAGVMINPRRPVCDPRRLELVRWCAPGIDNHLAPLVAAELVHRDIARIIAANLRVALLETSGTDAALAMSLPRTIKAIEVLETAAEQMGGA